MVYSLETELSSKKEFSSVVVKKLYYYLGQIIKKPGLLEYSKEGEKIIVRFNTDQFYGDLAVIPSNDEVYGKITNKKGTEVIIINDNLSSVRLLDLESEDRNGLYELSTKLDAENNACYLTFYDMDTVDYLSSLNEVNQVMYGRGFVRDNLRERGILPDYEKEYSTPMFFVDPKLIHEEIQKCIDNNEDLSKGQQSL